MQPQPAISFRNVSKCFTMTSERPQTILESLIGLVGGKRPRRQEADLWAVRDLTFDLMPGESLGIIGRNGSGKSTLLKLIARILRPSSGTMAVRGRVSALLELGAGFHPDLTGRENIYLNGSVLGLNKEEVDACFQSIVDFSELEAFIDVPVKHYSSGMYMRLGFSVAIHVRPDILLIDEILAVGDQAFQDKCVERIYAMKREGTTIVIVSHNLEHVRTLCSHLLWIENGRVQAAGPAHEIIARYREHSYKQRGLALANGNHAFRRWGTGEVEISGVRFLDARGKERRTFVTGEPLTIEISYVAHRPVSQPEFGLAIYRQDGVQINGPNNRLAGFQITAVRGAGTVRYCLERLPLLPALYHVTAAIHDSHLPRAYDFHERAYAFRVTSDGYHEAGLVDIPASWEWTSAPGEAATLPSNHHADE